MLQSSTAWFSAAPKTFEYSIWSLSSAKCEGSKVCCMWSLLSWRWWWQTLWQVHTLPWHSLGLWHSVQWGRWREVCGTVLVLSGSLLQWCVMINLICRLVTATALEPACHALIFSRGIFQSSSMTVVQYWYYIYYGYMEYRLGVDCCNAIIFS